MARRLDLVVPRRGDPRFFFLEWMEPMHLEPSSLF